MVLKWTIKGQQLVKWSQQEPYNEIKTLNASRSKQITVDICTSTWQKIAWTTKKKSTLSRI
jgi:hypothetical protein